MEYLAPASDVVVPVVQDMSLAPAECNASALVEYDSPSPQIAASDVEGTTPASAIQAGPVPVVEGIAPVPVVAEPAVTNNARACSVCIASSVVEFVALVQVVQRLSSGTLRPRAWMQRQGCGGHMCLLRRWSCACCWVHYACACSVGSTGASGAVRCSWTALAPLFGCSFRGHRLTMLGG